MKRYKNFPQINLNNVINTILWQPYSEMLSFKQFSNKTRSAIFNSIADFFNIFFFKYYLFQLQLCGNANNVKKIPL